MTDKERIAEFHNLLAAKDKVIKKLRKALADRNGLDFFRNLDHGGKHDPCLCRECIKKRVIKILEETKEIT